MIDGTSVIGAGAEIANGAHLMNCVVWENAKIASRARLEGCIVRDGRLAAGTQRDTDI